MKTFIKKNKKIPSHHTIILLKRRRRRKETTKGRNESFSLMLLFGFINGVSVSSSD
jgi:hypothetical protein